MDGATDDLFIAGETVYEFGIDLGIYRVSMFLDELADGLTQDQVDGGFFDGVSDASMTAGQPTQRSNSELERDDYDPQVTFTATDLLHQAANAIREDGCREGASVAVQAVRDWYDGLSGDNVKAYYEGILYALDQVGASFGVDPDPTWKPYDPPEDPEEED